MNGSSKHLAAITWMTRTAVAAIAFVAMVIMVPASAGVASGRTRTPKVPARPRESAFLNSASCTSSTNCVAVGNSDMPGGTGAFSVRWDGTGWTQLPAPPAISHGLNAVACGGDSLCVGIDSQGRLLQWDGSTWQFPNGLNDGAINGVATAVTCASAASCIAVGGNINPPLAAATWNGQTWTEHDPAVPAGTNGASLDAISCASAADCVAVGNYSTFIAGKFSALPLAMRWNGQSWSQLPVPAPSGTILEINLGGVSCTGTDSCLAVGDVDFNVGGNADIEGLAYAWDGSSWTATPQPIGIPASVSCWSGSGCATTDQVGLGAGGTGIPELWNGSSWAQLHPPLPNTEFNELNQVSCYGPATCLFAGGADNERPLALWWASGGWQLDRVVPRDGFAGVSCTSAFDCVAAGGYIDTNDDNATLTASINGVGWQLASTPKVSGTLTDISCDSPRDCVMVGGQGPNDLPLAEKWDGKSWQVLDTSFGAKVNGTQPIAVSCASGDCLAVTRDYFGAHYAQWWNGSSWRLIDVPTPRPHLLAQVSDVSCASASYCVVAGTFHNRKGPFTSFADLWNGKGFRVLRVPGNGLTSISCLSARFCMGITVNSAVTWNGSSWRVRKLPGFFGRPGLVAVSCASERLCMAVGNYVAEETIGNTIAFFNGSSWRILPALPPEAVLTDVSCAGRVAGCFVVGERYDGPAATQTFTATWTGSDWLLYPAPNP